MERVLILEAEKEFALPFLSFYCSIKWEVYVASPHRFAISFFSRFPHHRLRSPISGYLLKYGKGKLWDEEKLMRFILWLKKFSNKFKLILPLTEETLIPLVKFLKPRIYPSYFSVLFLHDKSLMVKQFSKLNIRSFKLPRTYVFPNLEFPCIVKPTKGAGSFHVYFCRNLKEVKKSLGILNFFGRKPLIQEYLHFDKKFGFNLLVDEDGQIRRLLFTEKISTSKVRKIVKDLEIFFKSINYFGFASPQFGVVNKKIYLLEINPRHSYYPYCYDFGLNFAESFHKLFVEKVRIKKKFKQSRIQSFFLLSKIYLEREKDLGCIIKAFESYVKSKILTSFTRSRFRSSV